MRPPWVLDGPAGLVYIRDGRLVRSESSDIASEPSTTIAPQRCRTRYAAAISRKPRGRARYVGRPWPRLAHYSNRFRGVCWSVRPRLQKLLTQRSGSIKALMRLIKILKNQAARTCLTALRPRSGGTEWMGCASTHARGLQRTRSLDGRIGDARFIARRVRVKTS